MESIEISGLAPQYRVYQGAGTYVRVEARTKDTAKGVYLLTAVPCDQSGSPLGTLSISHKIIHQQDQVDLPEFAASREAGGKGNLLRENGHVFEHSGAEWVDRGPLPAGASDAVAEILCMWDREARVLAAKTRRNWARLSEAMNIEALLGNAQES